MLILVLFLVIILTDNAKRQLVVAPKTEIRNNIFLHVFLPVRKWKSKTTLGADKKWEFEIGEDLSIPSPLESNHIIESRSNVSLYLAKDF